MNLLPRGILLLGRPRVRRAIAAAYLLGLILAIVEAWAIAAFVAMAPVITSLSACEGDELRTVELERTRFSLLAIVSRQVGLSWSPGQATGGPNTWKMGDITTAWASQTPDDRDEWVELDYAPAVLAQRIVIHETYNPGALSKITSIDDAGVEEMFWTGTDPAQQVPEGIWIADIPVKSSRPVNRIRLYLDSKRVAGWNEIDAVGLIDSAGHSHWSAAARASTTYASRNAGSHSSFVQLGAAVPSWVDTVLKHETGAKVYQAYGWPLLSMYGRAAGSPEQVSPIRPWWPVWPGLLANATLFGAIVLLIYGTSIGLRRFMRQSLWLRNGCCMQCGYDLRFDLARGCPECGWRRQEEIHRNII